MNGNHWQPMSLLNNASYCFYVGIQLSHNRLVAGSSPAGATKFSDVNHAVKPPFEVAFLFLVLNVPFSSPHENNCLHRGAHQLSPPGVLVEDFQNSEKNHEDFRGSIEE